MNTIHHMQAAFLNETDARLFRQFIDRKNLGPEHSRGETSGTFDEGEGMRKHYLVFANTLTMRECEEFMRAYPDVPRPHTYSVTRKSDNHTVWYVSERYAKHFLHPGTL